jgi:trigger factor
MAQYQVDTLAPLHQKLTLTLGVEEFEPKVSQGLKKIAKTASIKGFRPGMVPTGVVKRMYGNEILAEEISKLANDELDKYLKDNQIKVLGNPLTMPVVGQQININELKPYTFEIELGIQPLFELPNLTGKNALTAFNINIDDELLNKELDYEQTKNGKSEEVDEMIENDVISLKVTENKEAGFEKTINLLIKSVQNDDAKANLLKLKKGDTIAFDFMAAFNNDKIALTEKVFNIKPEEFEAVDFTNCTITVEKILRLVKAELNEELFKKVLPNQTINSIEEFKEALKVELTKVYAKETDKLTNNKVFATIIEATSMDFPIDFLKKWIKSVNKEPLTDEEVEKGFDDFTKDLKWTLIKNKIIIDNNLQIKPEEIVDKVKAYLKEVYPFLEGDMMDSFVSRVLDNEKEKDYLIDQMATERIFDYLKSKAEITTQVISLEEFENMNRSAINH